MPTATCQRCGLSITVHRIGNRITTKAAGMADRCEVLQEKLSATGVLDIGPQHEPECPFFDQAVDRALNRSR